MAVPPAAPRGPVSAEAPARAEPTQLHLAPAFLSWSVLAQGQLPLSGWDAASALLVPSALAFPGGAGGRWALGRLGAIPVGVVWHVAGDAAGWQCQAGENHPGLPLPRLFRQMPKGQRLGELPTACWLPPEQVADGPGISLCLSAELRASPGKVRERCDERSAVKAAGDSWARWLRGIDPPQQLCPFLGVQFWQQLTVTIFHSLSAIGPLCWDINEVLVLLGDLQRARHF